ncbi:MAG: hypothetical protein KKA16_10080 [Alphaproteobacteria bacterium]|nr:hypothetical protein [Alphaproteobacteria bacterium]MBU2380671.1 hypothetical protein [Alphaproteobacteria bacterium]
MGGKRLTVRGRSPGWSERPYSKRRAGRPRRPEPPRPVLDLVVALISLVIAVGGALFFGLEMLGAFKLPLPLGYGATLILLGAACLVSARRGWPRRVTAVGLAIALVAGVLLLYPGGPPWPGR